MISTLMDSSIAMLDVFFFSNMQEHIFVLRRRNIQNRQVQTINVGKIDKGIVHGT
jgi:hypothetical protein